MTNHEHESHEGNMTLNRPFCVSIAIAFLAVTIIIARFTALNAPENDPTTINALFVTSTVACIGSLFCASISLRSQRELFPLMLLVSLFAITMRMIPNLMLAFPPLHDPYYYITSTDNVTEYGVISPRLSDWHLQLDFHLKWPLLAIFSSTLEQTSALDDLFVLRYLSPILSVAFVTSLFLVAREATGSRNIAAASAIIGSCIDAATFYQSQYHPQGIALSLFFMSVYALLKIGKATNLSMIVILALLATALVMSHHFSSILVALVGLLVIALMNISDLVGFWGENPSNQGANEKGFSIKRVKTGWGLLIVAGLAYAAFVGIDAIRIFSSLGYLSVPFSALAAIGSNVPESVAILGSYKWLLLGLAVPTVITIKRKDTRMRHVALLLLALLLGIAVFNYIIRGPTDRLIALGFPLVGILASTTLFSVIDRATRSRAKSTILLLAITLLVVPTSMSALHPSVPSFYFDDSRVDTYYWYSNDLGSISRYGSSGSWIHEHFDQNAFFTVEFDTKVIPFYYGHEPISHVNELTEADGPFVGVCIMNPSIPYVYHGETIDKSAIIAEHGTDCLFDDGELVMFEISSR